MNIKKLVSGLLLSSALAAGVGVSVASQKEASKEAAVVEAAVTNGKFRVNVFVDSDNWAQDNIKTIFNAYSSGNQQMGKDADLGSADTGYSNYNSVEDVDGNAHRFQTVEFSARTAITKNDTTYVARSSAASDWWNGFGTSFNLYTQFRSNYWDNTFKITGTWDNFSATLVGWYNKVCLHTGLNLGTTSYKLLKSDASPSVSDQNVPSGYIFKGWYTDSALKTAWTAGSQYSDINLYAKYEVEPATGYYMVGDAAFMSEFGTSGDAFDFNSGVLMNAATGDNKAVYTFTNSTTIKLKARYYSHASNWWVSTTEKSESATEHGVTFDTDGNYVIPAGTYSLYVFVKNNQDASSLTWGMPLDSYCSEFLSQTGAVCAGSSTDVTALAAVWSTMSTDWGKLSSDDQKTLKSTVASETGTDAQKVMARYDLIIHNHSSFTDYMGRKSNANYTYKSVMKLMDTLKSSSSTIAIIAISGTVLAAIGGYFLFRKKKEN